MQKVLKYVIFETKWGYFGLAGTEICLCRTRLPGPKPEKIKSQLLRNLPEAQFDKTYFKTLQQHIAAYFKGMCVNFSHDIPVSLDEFHGFSRKVLTAGCSPSNTRLFKPDFIPDVRRRFCGLLQGWLS